ncbi:hypothetical protein [Paenibacillus albidus]|nr:hypothetical protein [Paenibacillus albidus]
MSRSSLQELNMEVSKMRWDEVQERFRNQWVVLEATKAYSK